MLEEETPPAAPTTNQVPSVRKSSRTSQLPITLKDYELFQDSEVNLEGELVHFALIAEAQPIEFDKAVTNKMWVRAMKKEIDSIEKKSYMGISGSSFKQEAYSTKMGL